MKKNYMPEDGQILEIKSDRLFHDMFNEHEMNTIEWTVMMILNKSYEEIHGKVKVGNIRLTNMSKNDMQKYVDLIVNLNDKKIIIELNNNYEGSYLRNTLYAMNIINNSYIESGDYYNEKIQGILVNLNWYKTNINNNYSKKEIIYDYPKDGEEKKDYLLKIININLDYYSNKCYNKCEGVDKLSKLLTIKDKKELKEFTSNEKLLNDYFNKMDRLSQNEEYCKMVWDERIDEKLRNIDAYNGGKMVGIDEGKKEGIIEGKREGIIEGKKEGIIEGKKEVIIKMYKDNLSVETISKYVDLSIEEIEKIIKSSVNG